MTLIKSNFRLIISWSRVQVPSGASYEVLVAQPVRARIKCH